MRNVTQQMNIILTGLRGSGKTKVGKIIAKNLKWNFVDLDDMIEKKEKMVTKNATVKRSSSKKSERKK